MTTGYDETTIGDRMTWHGYLTTQNADSVAAAIAEMFHDKPYTWVAVNELDPFHPDIRTSQRLKTGRPGGSPVSCKIENDRAYINVNDTYGCWDMGTSMTCQQDAHNEPEDSRDTRYLTIRRDHSISVKFRPGAGHIIVWTVTVEDDHLNAGDLRHAVGGEPTDDLDMLLWRAGELRRGVEGAHAALDTLDVPRQTTGGTLTLAGRIEAFNPGSIVATWLERDRKAAARDTEGE